MENENIRKSNLQALKRMDLSVIKFSVVEFESNCIIFIYCSVGSLATDQFHRFGDISYEFEWYKLPIDLQKYFTLIIADAQRPRVFTGFNIIDSNLMMFTKVYFEHIAKRKSISI